MSSYRSSYGSWNKPDTTKSNTNSSTTPATGTKPKTNSEIPTIRKYDTSYSRNKSDTSYNKDISTRSTSLDKPTSRYSGLSSSSFRSTYTPTYSRDRSSTRDKELLSPNSTSSSRYSNYGSEEKPERQSVLSKYMTTKANETKPNRLSPTPYSRLNTDSNIRPKSRDPSPPSQPYNYTRTTSNLSSRNHGNHEDVSEKNKDIHSQTKKTHENSANERDKDIPNKKTSSLNATLASYPSFKLYQRPSAYTRPTPKEDTKVDILPTSRFTPSSSRYTSGYNRNNFIENKPVSPTIIPQSHHNNIDNKAIETPTANNGISKLAEQDKPLNATDLESKKIEAEKQQGDESKSEEESSDDDDEEVVISITVVTRGTSPTPPSNSLYLRTRRADMAKTIEKTVQRPKYKGKMIDRSMQSDRLDDSTRSSRYIGTGSYSAPSYSRYIDNRYNVSSVSSGRYSSGRYSSYSRDSVKSPTNERVTSTSTDNSNSRSNESEVNGIEKNNEFATKKTEAESLKVSGTVTKSDNSSNVISGIPKPASIGPTDQSLNNYVSHSRDSAIPTKEASPVQSINSREKSKSMSPKPLTETNNNSVSKEPLMFSKEEKTTPTSIVREKSESMSPKPYCIDQLPPQVPKPELNTVGNINNSSSPPKTGKTTGKKIIKKVKVKSKDGEPKKKTIKKSLSNSSADSETSQNGDLESIAENTKEPKVKLKLKIKGILSSKHEENGKESSCDSPRHSKSRSLSRTSSDSTSSMNSASDVEFDDKIIENGIQKIPKIDVKSEYSQRTSNIATSEDEVSLSIDKSRKSSSPKPQPRTEEAKSFLMRALAPVTSLFKMRQESQEKSPGSDNNYDSDQNTLNIPSIATDDSRSSNSTNNVPRYKLSKFESTDKPWWLDSSANIPEGVEVRPPSRKGSSDSDQSEKYSVYKINAEEQSDKDFWQKINNNHPSSQVQSDESAHINNNYSSPSDKQESEKDWWDNINNDLSSMSNTKEMSEKDWWDLLKAKNPSTISLSNLSQKISDSNEPISEKDFWQKINNQMSTSSESEKDWWQRINNSCGQRSQKANNEHNFTLNLVKIKHIDSGERAWWLSSNKNIPEGVEKLSPSSEESGFEVQNNNTHENYKVNGVDTHLSDDESLGDRKSPEGLESPHVSDDYGNKTSPYGTCQHSDRNKKNSNNIPFFISRHMDIDDILGSSGQLFNPVRSRMLSRRTGREIMEGDTSEYKEIEPDQVKIHDSTAQRPVIQRIGSRSDIIDCRNENEPINLDDSTLQVYKDGDYGPYLDLDSSLNEQQEELEGFQKNRKNYIVLRTQLSVRVHAIREKLLNSDGRELRRALFSLKQIFQEDKDLVHEFVQNDGLDCLIRVGSGADQYYQNYILRALGQVMLYVDGMNGVMEHNASLQWLYSLIASKFRLVVKTTLKLLLVFVEYVDTNCMLLIKAIETVDGNQGVPPWTNIMNLLKDYDASDTELLIYAMTLINNCLNGIPDQDTYYDQTDHLEDQGMCSIIQRYMNKQGTDLDLLRQFQIYEAVLNHEDGDDRGTPPRQLEDSLREKLRHRMLNNSSRQGRKSRRHFLSSRTQNGSSDSIPRYNHTLLQSQLEYDEDEPLTPPPTKNSADVFRDSQEVTALQRRRDRVQRQRDFIIEQHKLSSLNKKNDCKELTNLTNGTHTTGIPLYTSGLQQRIQNGTLGHTGVKDLNIVNKQTDDSDLESPKINGIDDDDLSNKKPMLMIDKESTVKDITEKLCSNRNQIEEGRANLVENMTGIISKAMMGLAKSKSKSIVRSPTIEIANKEVKKSESDFSWESIIASLDRPLKLKDLDFTDLTDNYEDKSSVSKSEGWVPPPPPLVMNSYNKNDLVPPPPPKGPHFIAPPVPISQDSSTSSPDYHNKSKKTIKLFWREINDGKKSKVGSLWDEIVPVKIESKILEHLFESRTKDVIKQLEINKNKEVIVLDHKRSNAINILLKKLPPPQAIKNAILKMDATVLTREGIDKLIAMLPSEEETQKIQEAQVSNPSIPLGNAEQFLLTLSSISELNARLKLWVFKLDFEQIENEIAEPYMDFKIAMEILKKNNTFKKLISAILSTGNFLNSTDAKGFQVEYLAKIHEVKDTVHKHSLLHHLCHIILDQFPETTDLYSEIGPVTRASKVNFEELSANIERLEVDCKASTNYLKEILKHDGNLMKAKLGDFLHDCAERIIILSIIKKRLYQRYTEFLLWLGVPPNRISETRPSELFKVISEFALEYRTTRERVIEQRARKACHRERNKTRGKMIMDVGELLGPESAENQLTSILSSQDSNTHHVLSRKKLKDTDSIEKINKTNGGGIEEVFNSMLTSKISSDKKSEHHAKRHTKSSKGSSNMLNTRTVGMFNNYQMRGTKKTLAT